MKVWSAALANEAADWPQVRARSFFGFTGLYRNYFMFAILPRTRGMETPDAVAFRLDSLTTSLQRLLSADPRISSAEIKEARWFAFTLSTDADLHDALEWLSHAHAAAGKAPKGTNKSKKRK
jgi:hypothetical protein